MDTFEAIHTRRSVRKFTEEPASRVDLEQVFRAAAGRREFRRPAAVEVHRGR